MLQELKLKLDRWLPFLTQSGWKAPTTPLPNTGTALPPDQWQADGFYSGIAQSHTHLSSRSLPHLNLYRCSLPGSMFTEVELTDCRFTHVQLPESRLEGCTLLRAEWLAVDAMGLKLKGGTLEGGRLMGVSLREALLEELDLARVSIGFSDLFGAHLRRVKAPDSHWVGIDLSFSTLEQVDFSGADLRGCNFQHALFVEVNLEAALVQDADFRGARGLTPAQWLSLRERGALLEQGLLEPLFLRLFARLMPERAFESRQRLARRSAWAAWLLGVLTLSGVLFQLFFSGPFQPDSKGSEYKGAGQAQSEAPPTAREPTAEEVQKTQENLATLRAAIQAAFETSGRYGVARYPTAEELSNNEFDRDGGGPETDKLPLIPGGLPGNFLTPGEGISPYCNAVPTQGTLTGDDTDWHYCEETGRVFPCGGFTTAPTLSW